MSADAQQTLAGRRHPRRHFPPHRGKGHPHPQARTGRTTASSFRRIDIPDQPFIDADVDKVQTVERATTLAEGSVKVHTVEHVISALTGMGVDNALIEMDANEPPIGDGSAKPPSSN